MLNRGSLLLHSQGKLEELRSMYREWPFFAATMDLIEMILAKSDMRIASLYDVRHLLTAHRSPLAWLRRRVLACCAQDVLVSEPSERKLGQEIRGKLQETIKARIHKSNVCG